MVDEGTLATVGSVVVGFGIAAFVFRLQRELQMIERDTAYWIPWADRLLVGIVTAGLLLILFPIALAGDASVFWGRRVPAAACSGSAMALAGYLPALLAHYRFGPQPARIWIWFGSSSPRDRSAGEPAEKAIVVVSALLGVGAAIASLLVTG